MKSAPTSQPKVLRFAFRLAAIRGDQVTCINIEGSGQLSQPLQGRALSPGHDLPEVAPADSGTIRQVRDRDLEPFRAFSDVPDYPAVKLVHGRHPAKTVGSVLHRGVRYGGLRYGGLVKCGGERAHSLRAFAED